MNLSCKIPCNHSSTSKLVCIAESVANDFICDAILVAIKTVATSDEIWVWSVLGQPEDGARVSYESHNQTVKQASE